MLEDFIIYHNCIAKNDLPGCAINITVGIGSVTLFILNFWVMWKLTSGLTAKRYYVPIFITSLFQDFIVWYANIITTSFKLFKTLQISAILFYYLLILKFVLLDTILMKKRFHYKSILTLTVLAVLGISWGVRNSILFNCGNNQKLDFLVDFCINTVYLITLYLRGHSIVKKKSLLEDGAEIGFLRQLDRRIRNIVVILTLNVLIFYSMTYLWNDQFSDFYYCINTGSFLSKNIYGDLIVLCKCVSILSTSFVVNTFFYLSLDRSENKNQDDGLNADSTTKKSSILFDDNQEPHAKANAIFFY